jgi:hypothetical protein
VNRVVAASPPLKARGRCRARLRARPSGLKGRGRDRCATDLRPALDPGASTAPHRAAAPGSAGALPAKRAAPATKPRSNRYNPSLYGFRGLPIQERSRRCCDRRRFWGCFTA